MCPPEFISLFNKCWTDQQQSRPTCIQIIHSLENIILSTAIKDSFFRQFWTENFGNAATVSYHSFTSAFEMLPLWNNNLVQRQMAEMLLLPRELTPYVTLQNFGRFLDLLGPKESLTHNLKNTVSQKWFFGELTDHEVAVHLAGEVPNTFLVRILPATKGINAFAIDKLNSTNEIEEILLELSEMENGTARQIIIIIIMTSVHASQPGGRGGRGGGGGIQKYSSLNEAVEDLMVTKGYPCCPQSPFKEFSVSLPTFVRN